MVHLSAGRTPLRVSIAVRELDEGESVVDVWLK